MRESMPFTAAEYIARLEAERMARFNEVVTDLNKAEAEFKARITAPGGIEDLVKDGRSPLFVDSTVGTKIGQEQRVMCFIPPEGTQFGDTMTYVGGVGPHFTSPEGIQRGFAGIIEFTPEEARPLMERVKAALSNPSLA